jgi:Fur family ferric uptake transcriptional regulator
VTVPHLTPAVQASSAHAAFATLRARGLRLSSARRLLLQALYAADRPVSAEELAGEGDVASAYRNLEVLEGLGLVAHVHLGHGPGRYQPAGRPRAFVLCEACGAVRALPPAALDAVHAAVLEAVGYRPRFSHFPIAGLCPACSTDHETPEEEPAC